ncbi:MAG: hypothetical protein QOI20_2075 [Acidimicrobiaceae bacterium]|jgi:hypothetical protein|nr:hypothetical protein [Acidimicrobiaceae bacterium]
MESTTRRTGMRTRAALLAAVLAFAVAVAGLVAVASRDTKSSPPRLSYGVSGTADSARARAGIAMSADSVGAAPAMFPYFAVEYRLDPGVGRPVDSAPAYRLHGPTKEAVARLAVALGLGPASERDGFWVADDTAEHHLQVDQRTGLWTFGPDPNTAVGSASSGSVSSSITACAPCPPDAVCAMQCKPTPDPPGPADDEAEQAARTIWRKAGIDPGSAEVQVKPGYGTASVSFSPLVEGLPVLGLDTMVDVGLHGVVNFASGWLGAPEKLGDYPLVDMATALKRLNDPSTMISQGGAGRRMGVPEPMTATDSAGATASAPPTDPPPALGKPTADKPPVATPPTDGAPADEPSQPQPVPVPVPEPVPPKRVETLTSVRLVLQYRGDSLLPVYVFTNETGADTPAVPAVPDDLIAPDASGRGTGERVPQTTPK